MKTLETIVFVAAAVAVAVFAPEFLPALIPGISALGIAAATAAIEIGLSLASNALIGPSVPKGLGAQTNNQVQRLFVTMDTTSSRKIVFGTTAGATDLRYQSYTGTNQRYYEQIIAVASHQVNSIFEIWFDNEKAWTSGGGVQGRFVGFLTVDAVNLGTSLNGIAIDSVWTTTCTLTGCAYIHLKFDLLGAASTGGTNNSPFASGVTSRVTVRTNGALIYDPRLDSTVAGGSGTQRAATQSTWAWDANASRNPALQILWYLLGWKINSKLAVGRGIPSSRIDLASFAVAANACDASITLNGGGTEPRYRSDGVLTEGDDPLSVIEGLCAAMNAVLRDAGGKLSLTVLTNDLASPVASFTEADILGSEQWDQTPALSSTFNICRGRRVDASDNALYQLVDVPEASLTSNDGIDRIDTMDMPFVSSNGQAQRLLKQRLQRKQYQGKYTFIGNARWWQTSLGNVVQMSHAGLGWANKLFRVAGQSISRDGTTKMTLIEENAAIYAWANNEAAAVTPGTPTVYDPLNSPLSTATVKLGGVEAGADVTSNHGALGDGNRVRFSRMEGGTKGWSNRVNTSGNTVATTTGLNNGRAFIQSTGTFSAAAQSVSICSNFAIADYRIPVIPSERLYIGALPRIDTLPASSTWRLEVSYLDSTGAAIGASTQTVGSGGGALTPETFEEIFANANVSAYFAFVELTITSGASGAFSFSLYNPMLCSAGAAQTVRPSFSPGPSTEVGATNTTNTNQLTDSANLGITAVVIDPIGDSIISADSTGTIKVGELPRNIALTASVGSSVVTTAGAWSMTATTGVTATIGSATGILNITAMAVTEVYIPVTFVYNSITRTAKVHVVVVSDPPTNSGGSSGSSGSSVSTTTLGVTTGTAYDTTNAVSATLTITAGAAGSIALSAPIAYKRNSSASGDTGAAGKWQWCVHGGTFADVTTETVDSSNFAETDTGPVVNLAGSLDVNTTKAGLTSGTSYDFRFLWREVAVSGTAAHIYRSGGTLTATAN